MAAEAERHVQRASGHILVRCDTTAQPAIPTATAADQSPASFEQPDATGVHVGYVASSRVR